MDAQTCKCGKPRVANKTLCADCIAKRKAAMQGPTEEGDLAEYRAMCKARELRAKLG